MISNKYDIFGMKKYNFQLHLLWCQCWSQGIHWQPPHSHQKRPEHSEKDQIHQLSRNLFAKPVPPYHFWLCNWSGHRHNMTAAVCQSGTPGDPRLPSRRSSSTRNNGTLTGDKENIEMRSKAGRHFHFPRIHPNMYPSNMYPSNMYPPKHIHFPRIHSNFYKFA